MRHFAGERQTNHWTFVWTVCLSTALRVGRLISDKSPYQTAAEYPGNLTLIDTEDEVAPTLRYSLPILGLFSVQRGLMVVEEV